MKKSIPLFLLLAIIVIFFRQFFLHGLLPIPSDTLVGLYNPFRDVYAQQYSRGVPFKNFLTTDPIRQQYPWRELAISLEKNFSLPVWNPYTFSGSPLLANFQTAAFYPLNIFFFFLPFPITWSLLIFLQPLLAGIFLYLYLKNLKLHPIGAFVGSIAFAFSGFSVAWLEWNSVVQTILWLPLLLLSIDKVFGYLQVESGMKNKELGKLSFWFIIFTFSLCSSFFAGHLQTFFYVFLIQFAYLLLKLFYTKSKKRYIFLFSIFYLLFLLLTAIQWIPTIQFIFYSARSIDVNYLTDEGWFIPWQHLVQFIAPDFFGNPTTLNYWGIWNYGEFIGYIGILPLIFAMYSLVGRHDKKTYFFSIIAFVALLFALPTSLAKLPFAMQIPLLSTSQPTRLIGIVDFALAILSALGLDYFIKGKKIQYKLFIVLTFFACLFLGLWLFVLKFHFNILSEHLLVAHHNLIFPTATFAAVMIILILFVLFRKHIPDKIQVIILSVAILITILDQLRFSDKFTPFTQPSYLYPSAAALTFLQQHQGNYRYMTTDSQILPPNVSTIYRLQTIEGYDPLYIERYGAFIAAMQRSKPDISTPFGFNRIIVPHDPSSPFINLLGVKYVLSLTNIHQAGLTKVFEEGQTKIYQNNNVLPRAFFVKDVVTASSQQDAIEKLSAYKSDLESTAIVEGMKKIDLLNTGSATITSYTPNSVIIKTENKGKGFLILTDVYYPSWHAMIDGEETSIFLTDFTFRGILVPPGAHTIVFSDHLF